jgi:hypothetical protein
MLIALVDTTTPALLYAAAPDADGCAEAWRRGSPVFPLRNSWFQHFAAAYCSMVVQVVTLTIFTDISSPVKIWHW